MPHSDFRNTKREALKKVQQIYADLEQVPAERNCSFRAGCCHFKNTGLTPSVTDAEALVAAQALRASGRRKIPESPDGACPLLDRKTLRCIIYEARPFGCRTHFCKAAGGPFARRDVIDLIRRLEEVEAGIGGRGPRPFLKALKSCLSLLS
ncbi:MAG: YkgJ family cysteine cluster protein [Chthoniobacterales bacterium]